MLSWESHFFTQNWKLAKVTNAQCPMPNAQCPMPNAQFPTLKVTEKVFL
ncbi:MAG: hypothetical protein V7K68_32795 [Nostoc sp.]